MGRFDLLKTVFELKSFEDDTVLELDIDQISKLYERCLINQEFVAAHGITLYLESDKSNHLFSEFIQKQGLLNSYLEPKNWKSTVDIFSQLLMRYLNDVIEKQDFTRFEKMLCLLNFQRFGIQTPLVLGRELAKVKLKDFAKKLHILNLDTWVVSILQCKELNSIEIYTIINEVLINCNFEILNKASKSMISRYSKEKDIFNYYDDVETETEFIELLINTKQFDHLKMYLREFSLNQDKLFRGIRDIFENAKYNYIEILEQIYQDYKKFDNFSNISLWICLLNNDEQGSEYIIDNIMTILENSKTKAILKQIKEDTDLKPLNHLKFEQPYEAVDGTYGKQWIDFISFNDYLLNTGCTLYFSSIILGTPFDLFDFINKYNLSVHKVLDRVFYLIPAYFEEFKSNIFLQLNIDYGRIIESNNYQEEKIIDLCQKFICNYYACRMKDDQLLMTSNTYISTHIIKNIKDSTDLKATVMHILNNIHDFEGVTVNLPVPEKSEVEPYVRVALWACLRMLKNDLTVTNKKHVTYLFRYIEYVLNNFYDILIYENVNNNLKHTHYLNNLKNLYNQFEKLVDKKTILNSTIKNILESMIAFFQENEFQDEVNNLAEARIEERNKIMANLSHTVKNMLSSVIDPLEKIKETGEVKPVVVDNAIRGANLIRSLVNSMNLSFKGSLEDFIYDVQNNTYENSSSIEAMFTDSLKQSISTTFDGKYYKKFVDNFYPTKAKFLEAKQKWNDISNFNDLDKILSFMDKYLMKTTLSISQAKDYVIGDDKGSALKLLILIQEIILNAVKYSSFVPKDSRSMQIYFSADDKDISIKALNTLKPNVQVKSSGLGNEIIKNFAKLLHTKPIIKSENEIYSVEIIFKNIWRNS